jgi:hypothetical protein
MATLATSYLNARNEVPGADATNMPDTKLLAPANNIYGLIFTRDSARIVRYGGGTFGWATTSGSRVVASTGTNFARIERVGYEAADATSTTGLPLERLTGPQMDREIANFPGTAGRPRCYTVEPEEASGRYTLRLHPAPDDTYYLSFYGEIFPQALTSGSSTLLVSPQNILNLDLLLAHWIAIRLGKTADFLNSILARVNDHELVAKWLRREDSRDEPVKGEDRGRP